MRNALKGGRVVAEILGDQRHETLCPNAWKILGIVNLVAFRSATIFAECG